MEKYQDYTDKETQINPYYPLNTSLNADLSRWQMILVSVRMLVILWILTIWIFVIFIRKVVPFFIYNLVVTRLPYLILRVSGFGSINQLDPYNIRPQLFAKQSQNHVLVVANHTSYIDILVLATLGPLVLLNDRSPPPYALVKCLQKLKKENLTPVHHQNTSYYEVLFDNILLLLEWLMCKLRVSHLKDEYWVFCFPENTTTNSRAIIKFDTKITRLISSHKKAVSDDLTEVSCGIIYHIPPFATTFPQITIEIPYLHLLKTLGSWNLGSVSMIMAVNHISHKKEMGIDIPLYPIRDDPHLTDLLQKPYLFELGNDMKQLFSMVYYTDKKI